MNTQLGGKKSRRAMKSRRNKKSGHHTKKSGHHVKKNTTRKSFIQRLFGM